MTSLNAPCHCGSGKKFKRCHGKPAARAIRQQLGPPKQHFSPLPLDNRRLRIAYLSADFRKHPVANFITPVLEAHNRHKFKIFAYYSHQHKDAWTDRARRAVDIFRPVADLSAVGIDIRRVELLG